MFKESDGLVEVEPETKIWRYQSVDKFVDFLESVSLYFCRADRFRDQPEGTQPDYYYPRMARELSATNNEWEAWEYLAFEKAYYKSARTEAYVNCWRMDGRPRSWVLQAYVPSARGVAVRSSVMRFQRALDAASEEVFLAKVNYVDFTGQAYSGGEPPTGNPYNTKRRQYSFERELRAITFIDGSQFPRCGPRPHGIVVAVRLQTMLEEVLVGPSVSDADNARLAALLKAVAPDLPNWSVGG